MVGASLRTAAPTMSATNNTYNNEVFDGSYNVVCPGKPRWRIILPDPAQDTANPTTTERG